MYIPDTLACGWTDTLACGLRLLYTCVTAYDCCIPVSRLTTAAYLCHGLTTAVYLCHGLTTAVYLCHGLTTAAYLCHGLRLLYTCVTALRLLYTCVTALRLLHTCVTAYDCCIPVSRPYDCCIPVSRPYGSRVQCHIPVVNLNFASPEESSISRTCSPTERCHTKSIVFIQHYNVHNTNLQTPFNKRLCIDTSYIFYSVTLHCYRSIRTANSMHNK